MEKTIVHYTLSRDDAAVTGFSILAYDVVFLYASPQIVTQEAIMVKRGINKPPTVRVWVKQE